ncbi:MAG: cation diffusion facilitator family transporter [Candidatus Krumholzibacteria bacterium]|nr:cation diffusion facilitator family transporter [Candidatus Krumholzibacteria bacterium]
MISKHEHRPKTKDSLGRLADYRSVEQRKLKLTMAITGSVMVVEVIGGILTRSLALLSDAGHMFTHFFALGVSFAAIRIACTAPCHHRTFGFYRAEVLAALFNSLFLFAVTAYILYAGVHRLMHPEPVLGLQMLFVAVIGLVVNVASVLILRGSARDDLNIKGAFLHVMADTVSSVVIIVGAIVIYFSGWNVIDPLLAIGISVVIAVWAWGLLKDSVNILLEVAPRGVTADDVSAELRKAIPEIREIHDMHIWVITSNMYSLTAHVAVDPAARAEIRGILERMNRLLDEKYDIEHTTIQFDA